MLCHPKHDGRGGQADEGGEPPKTACEQKVNGCTMPATASGTTLDVGAVRAMAPVAESAEERITNVGDALATSSMFDRCRPRSCHPHTADSNDRRHQRRDGSAGQPAAAFGQEMTGEKGRETARISRIACRWSRPKPRELNQGVAAMRATNGAGTCGSLGQSRGSAGCQPRARRHMDDRPMCSAYTRAAR